MPGGLLASQLATLEPVGPEEAHVAVDIHDDPASLVDRIVRQLAALEGRATAVA